MYFVEYPYMEKIGPRIVCRRKLLGLKGKELAKRVGCYPPDISGWENNKNIPSVESLIKLARALETTETWLVSGKNPASTKNAEGNSDMPQIPVVTKGRESDNSASKTQWENEMIQDKNQIIELQKEKIRFLEDRLAKLEGKKRDKVSKKLVG
jgi:transcriptional regulator with XRE-family HTH domain